MHKPFRRLIAASAFLLLAGVFAFPASWRAKLVGAAAGVTLLMVLNLIRIISLFYIGVYWPKMFETAHIEVWQALFVGLTLLLWLGWAWQVMRHPEPRDQDARADR